jgi:hypothetical protein
MGKRQEMQRIAAVWAGHTRVQPHRESGTLQQPTAPSDPGLLSVKGAKKMKQGDSGDLCYKVEKIGSITQGNDLKINDLQAP